VHLASLCRETGGSHGPSQSPAPHPLQAANRRASAEQHPPWSGLGNGETCDACELSITNGQWVTEGLSLGGDRKLQLHVECFHF
jgi:hypothetical protein